MPPSVSTRKLAAVAVFATIYAVLNQIPVSKLIGGSGTLTFAEIFSPLAGMVLGPLSGAGSVFLGTFESVVLGRPLVFFGFDFIPAVAAAITAGLAFRKRILPAVVFSLALFLIFSFDPFSLQVIRVAGLPVPYFWMQLVAISVLVVIGYSNRAHRRFATVDVLIVAIVFLSTMNAQVAGAIMYENVFVYGGVSSPKAVLGLWPIIFYAYPVERAFFTVAGALLAIPVLRALPPSVLETLRRPLRGERRPPGPSPSSP